MRRLFDHGVLDLLVLHPKVLRHGQLVQLDLVVVEHVVPRLELAPSIFSSVLSREWSFIESLDAAEYNNTCTVNTP